MVRLILYVLLGGLILTVACERPQAPSVAARPSGEKAVPQFFQVKGIVQAINATDKTVMIKHEEIPGYMPAMTMPFEVKTTNELAGLAPGDSVGFRMVVTDTEGWIEQIKKLGSAKVADPTTTAKVRVLRDVEPLDVGDALPEYHFTNQFGVGFSTSQFKGNALAINFLFTRCPFPTFCPLTANNFAETQRKLLARMDAPANWRLLTISFDPDFDTPAILKGYGERYQYDSNHWTLATGNLTDITAIAEQFGQTFWHDETGSITHNLRAVVVDPAGRVQKIIVGNKWTSDELVDEIVQAAKKK